MAMPPPTLSLPRPLSLSQAPPRLDGCPPLPLEPSRAPQQAKAPRAAPALPSQHLPDRIPPRSAAARGQAPQLLRPRQHVALLTLAPTDTDQAAQHPSPRRIDARRPRQPRHGRLHVPTPPLHLWPRHSAHGRGWVTWLTPPPRRHCPAPHARVPTVEHPACTLDPHHPRHIKSHPEPSRQPAPLPPLSLTHHQEGGNAAAVTSGRGARAIRAPRCRGRPRS